MLMSPRHTLTSWGSSSSDRRRSQRPTAVMRASSGNKGLPSGASIIVRSLRTTNGRPRQPTRSWRKRTGRPEVMRTAIAQMAPITAAGSAATASSTRSTTRLPRYGPIASAVTDGDRRPTSRTLRSRLSSCERVASGGPDDSSGTKRFA